MPESLTVLGTHRHTFAVAFAEDCSGIEAPTRVGSFDATAVLPQLTWSDDSPLVERPPVMPPATVLFVGDAWGEPGTWDPTTRRVDVWWARGFFLTLEASEEDLSNATQELASAIGSWTSRLTTWIEATTRQEVGRGPVQTIGDRDAAAEARSEGGERPGPRRGR